MVVPDVIRLQQGAMELALCPELGGVITALRHAGRDVMQPASAAFFESGDPREASSFPLVPFSGRVADGRFRFQGQVYQLEPNFPPEPHAIHGHGWQNPWQVIDAGAARAVLAFEHHVPQTPLHYRARQTFTLSDTGLAASIEVTNTGEKPMPAGIGLHPYFNRTPSVTLQAELDHVWLADARNIPKERVALPPAWDFAQASRVAALEMDNGFGGWDGRAAIHWLETGLSLEIEAEPVLRDLVIFIPPHENFFCVEPVSNANDGFNLFDRGAADSGVRVLAPGETLSGRVDFRIS